METADILTALARAGGTEGAPISLARYRFARRLGGLPLDHQLCLTAGALAILALIRERGGVGLNISRAIAAGVITRGEANAAFTRGYQDEAAGLEDG